MNNIKTASAAIVLSALSFGAFAAEPVTATHADNTSRVGITRASDVSRLEYRTGFAVYGAKHE